MRGKKVIYYKNELTDDFAGTKIKTKKLSKDFKYVHHNPFWKLMATILYRGVAQPIIWVFTKVWFLHRFENRHVLKDAKKNGAFMYYNHTNIMFDAFIPNLVAYRKRNYIIVNPDATSIPGLKNVVQMLGAIPVGTDLASSRKMYQCVEERAKEKSLISIYPEAHIWPYYTHIRPFDANSFRFPVKLGKPVYAVTNCYQERFIGRRPKVVTFVDGPFYPREDLNLHENMEYLRDEVLCAMRQRTLISSTYEYVEYRREGEEEMDAFEASDMTTCQN